MNKLTKFWCILLLAPMFFLLSCDDDEPTDDDDGKTTPSTDAPVASFRFEVDEENFLKVNFSNFSKNATSYSWDFGDSKGTSDEEAPSYTYESAGTYTVTLTAKNDAGDEDTKSEEVEVTNPDAALELLAGSESKTWYLLRDAENVSMALAKSNERLDYHWFGFTNDGSRPCMMDDTFTFHKDGKYTYNDGGSFWAESAVFNNVEGCDTNTKGESCFDATAENMVNECGDDVSAWLSGEHQYEYDATAGTITLTGEGAWIGIPKLGTSSESNTPANEVTFNVKLAEGGDTGPDSLEVTFDYGGAYWIIHYVAYNDTHPAPAIVTEKAACPPYEETSPTEISHTFASNEASEWTLLQPIVSGSELTLGVDDPTDATATKVGKYTRKAGIENQELKFGLEPRKSINFENLTTMTMDVYMPSSNAYDEATLTDNVFIGFGRESCQNEWWNDNLEYQEMDVEKDKWVTLSFDLSSPQYVNKADNGASVKERNDFDMLYIAIGGGGHVVGGEFYIRNLSVK